MVNVEILTIHAVSHQRGHYQCGKMIQAPDLTTSEVMASFRDPAGNTLGLYQQSPG